MTINEQDNLISVLSTSTSITENLGKQARLESEKCFEATYAKILPKIRNHIAVASTKGLWRTRIELPLSPWTLDKENQRRLIEKLKDNELKTHIKIRPNKIFLILFWSEADMKRNSLELLEASEDLDSLPSHQKRLEQPNVLLIEQPTESTQRESQSKTLALVPYPASENIIENEADSSSNDEEVLVVQETRGSQKAAKREAALLAEKEKEQKKLARQQQIQEMKRSKEEKAKELLKIKEEEKLKRKAQKEQRQLLNREKKEKEDKKKKKESGSSNVIIKTEKRKKKESSSEEIVHSENDWSSNPSESESN